jgi:hypothetical protein
MDTGHCGQRLRRSTCPRGTKGRGASEEAPLHADGSASEPYCTPIEVRPLLAATPAWPTHGSGLSPAPHLG